MRYSRCPKTERSVSQTEPNLVRLPNVRFFVRFTRLDHIYYFFYIKRSSLATELSEIGTNQTKFRSDFETERILQPNNFKKRQNPNVQILALYCISQ